MDREERNAIVVVSAVMIMWMLLLAARIVFVPFEEPLHEHPGPTEPARINIGFLDSVDSLNPNIGLNEPSWFFYSLVYDCLTTVDDKMRVTGNLARSWWMVPETDPAMIASGEPFGSVWQYNLSHDALWHDGVQFTADDVAYTLNMNAQHIDDMWAYQPYTYYLKEAEKVDDYTVRIHFWNRDTGLSIPVSWGNFIPVHILPKHLLEQLPGGSAFIGMNWTGTYPNATSPGWPLVGTGPWMANPTLYSDWVDGRRITVFRNPNYHWKIDKPGNPEIKIDQLTMKFFQESTSAVLALMNKELEAAKFPPTAFNAIRDKIDEGQLKNVTCFSGPSCAQEFVYLSFWMDTVGGPNDARLDSDVRTAMAMAIDKEYLVDTVFLGLAEPGTTVIPPINSGWHYEPAPSELIPYNITAAMELLESAGYIDLDSDGIRECTIASKAVLMDWVVEGEKLHFEVPVLKYHSEDKDLVQYLKTKWAEVGIDATYTVVDYDLWETMCPIQQDVSVSRWESLDPDPQFILFSQSEAARDSWSDTRYSNSSYDENLNLSVSALNPGIRKTYTDNCQRVLYEECPYIVLAYPNSSYAWRDDSVSGWGDWANDPGRSLDSCWGANPLFFDLQPYNYYGPLTEPQSSPMSTPLNVVIAVAAVATVVVFYMLWRRGSGADLSPKNGQ